MDLVAVARHLGHNDGTIALRVDAHMFKPKNDEAAGLVGTALGCRWSRL